MYESHTQIFLEDEFLGPHRTCMARLMENAGAQMPKSVMTSMYAVAHATHVGKVGVLNLP